VQDLYYWVADGDLDTLLLLQNYFSVFYPELDTHTSGTVTLFDDLGAQLGVKTFELGPFSCAKMLVSSLLAEFRIPGHRQFGTLECHLAIPDEVLHAANELYFFDRFYIGYTNSRGQPTFVHGVDRTHIYREDKPQSRLWYRPGKKQQWAPEIPVDIENYRQFSVILINRTSRRSNTTLIVSDRDDRSMRWDASIEPRGVHRFELSTANTTGLDPRELRLRVEGMPTRLGRPVVFKEFPNGAMSVMHC
jgi:hypothetical protein